MTSIIQLGHWSLDPATGELSHKEESIILPRQQHRLLMTLVHAGQDKLVTRETIISALWPDGRVVEYDQSLNAGMRKLRRALGDSSDKPIFIETVTGKGYRLKVTPKFKDSAPNNKLIYASVLGIVLAVSVWFLWPASEQKRLIPELAVMPVKSVPAESQDPMSLSLREELLNQFNRAAVNQLIILAPGSVDANGAKTKIPGRLYLHTSISQDPINKRIHLRLLDDQDTQLWSESFDWLKGGGTRSYQSIANHVAQSVADTLNIVLPQNSNTAQILADTSLDSFNQGLYLIAQGTPVDLSKAVNKFNEVLSAYPNYVPALAKLAHLYTKLASSDPARRVDHFEQVKAYAEHALLLDQTSTEAWVALAYYQLYHGWNYAQARVSLDKAISISPNQADARSLDAAWYASQGDMPASIEQARLAKRIDPQSMTVNADLCWYLNFATQFQQAEQECRQILTLQPKATWTRLGLVEAYRQQSNWSDAVTQLMTTLGAQPAADKVLSQDELQNIYQSWLAKMLPLHAQGNIDAYFIATLYAAAGNNQQALEWLQKSLRERNGFLVFVRVDPRFTALHESDGFSELLNAVYP